MKKGMKHVLSVLVLLALFICGAVMVNAEDTDSDKIKFLFTDSLGNVVSTVITEGTVPETEGINGSVFDVESSSVRSVDVWCVEIAGTEYELSMLDPTVLCQFLGSEIRVYPKTSVHTINTYAVYITDSHGVNRLVGSPSVYSSMETIKNSVDNAPDGAFVKLLYPKDEPYDVGGNTTFNVCEGQTLNFDLNGRTLVQSYGSLSGYGRQLFNVNEESTLNIFSTQSGGAFYQAKFHSLSDLRAYAPGIVTFAGGIKNATLNFGNIYSEDGELLYKTEGQLSLYGGSLIFVYEGEDNSELIDAGRININVDGGYFYHSLRSGYAVFTVRSPNVYINARNSTFLNVNTTYSVFHDYADPSSGNPYYSTSHVYAYNCEFVCRNSDNTDYTKLYFRMSPNSTAYFEDCLILAAKGSLSGNATLGGGNVVAGGISSSFKLGNAVKIANINSARAEAILSHPPLYVDMDGDIPSLIKDSNNKYTINPDVFNKDLWITDRAFGAVAELATYVDGEKYNHVKDVVWLDLDGKPINTEYWAAGSLLKQSDGIITKREFYGINCDWVNSDGSSAAEYQVKRDGDNLIYSKYGNVVGYIGGKYANLTLSNNILFNLYFPMDNDDFEIIEIKASDENIRLTEATVDGVKMNLLVWYMPLGSFASNSITVRYKLNFVEGANYFEGRELEYRFDIDIMDYVTALMNDLECGTSLSSLVYSMIDYKVSAAKFVNDEFTVDSLRPLSDFYSYYSDTRVHKEGECSCIDDKTPSVPSSELNVEYDNLYNSGIKKIDFVIEKTGLFTFTVELRDNIGDKLLLFATDVNKEEVLVRLKPTDSEFVYVTDDIPAYLLKGVLTLQIGEGEDAVKGTISLGKVLDDYRYFGSSEDGQSPETEILEKMYVYASRTRGYKQSLK